MNSNDSARAGIFLDPLDPLFFRDARPFGPGSHAVSTTPNPQVSAGALRTYLLRRAGCDLDRLPREGRFRERLRSINPAAASILEVRFRGPWLALREGKSVRPYVPVPAVLVGISDDHRGGDPPPLTRLSPLRRTRLPGWQPPEEGILPLWHYQTRPVESLPGWYLAPDGLRAFLRGDVPEPNQLVPESRLFRRVRHTGIAVNASTHAAEEHAIYTAEMLALAPDVGLYVETDGRAELLDGLLPAQGAPPDTIPLGGEGRRAAVCRVEPFAWPESPPRDGKRQLLLLVTPGLFDRNPASSGTDEERRKNWRPTLLKGKLAAAAIGGHVAFSGWDYARRAPKPNRFAVAAGSVYFLNEPLRPEPPALACNAQDELQGWGVFLKGGWDHV